MNKDTIRKLILGFAGLGFLDSLYLTYYKLSKELGTFCIVSSGCDVVNTSVYSEFLSIPVAAWGMLFYLAIIFVVLSELDYFVFGFSLVGILVSAYLSYLQSFVIGAYCSWCIVSAIFVLIIFILSSINFYEKFTQK